MDKELRGQMQSAQIPESKAEEAAGCCCRTKSRTEKEQRDLINRLSRIEGQIRGLKGMVERDAYCIDIINQAAAANSALSSFSKELLSCHIRTCVEEDIREGREEKVEELVKTLQKLLRLLQGSFFYFRAAFRISFRDPGWPGCGRA